MDKDNKNQDNKSLTHIIGEGVAMYSAGSIVNKFSGFATSLIKIRFLSVFHYGLLSLTITAVYFFNGLVTMGISEVVTADLNRIKGEGKTDVYKALLIGYIKSVCLLAIVFWALLFFGTDLIGLYYDNSVLPYIKLFSFIILITPLRTLYTTIFKTHLKFKYLVNWSVSESYINLGLVIVLVWLFDFGIKGVIYAELIYHLISLIIFGPFLIKVGLYLLKQKRSPGNYFWQIIKNHGKWALLTNYFGDFTKKIRPWFIAYFLNVEMVAIFSVAQSFYNHLISLLPIKDVLAQIFPREFKYKIKIGQILNRSFKYSLIIFILVGVVSAFVVPWIVAIIFPRYLDSIYVFRVLLIAMPAISLLLLQTPIYNAMQRQKDMFFLTLVKNIMIILLSLLLIPFIGVIGSAIEYVITIYCYVLLRNHNISRIASEFKINWNNLIVLDKFDIRLAKKILNRIIFIKK